MLVLVVACRASVGLIYLYLTSSPYFLVLISYSYVLYVQNPWTESLVSKLMNRGKIVELAAKTRYSDELAVEMRRYGELIAKSELEIARMVPRSVLKARNKSRNHKKSLRSGYMTPKIPKTQYDVW